MQKILATALGKSVRLATRARKSGGQALPGLVVENVFPNYMAQMLNKLPEGVVVVTGTNGKTTTTKILVELLAQNGKRVLTNSTGSNMTRGIVSTLTKNARLTGKLPYDMAVLEVDEASTRRLMAQVKPAWVLALNVSRDQLDRFGEVDSVARLIGELMQTSRKGVIVNADDPLLVAAAKGVKNIDYFGVSPALREFFPSDYEIVSVGKRPVTTRLVTQKLAVELLDFKAAKATYRIGSEVHEATFALGGQHNLLNLAAAFALAHKLLPKVEPDVLVGQAARVSMAFGRGEVFNLGPARTVELVLVKNPAGFRQALASYANRKADYMIAINDRFADGRDVSWLWDIDFSGLMGRNLQLTSGSRAADMALRLSYDNVKVDHVAPSIDAALNELVSSPGDKLIFATYTAMLQLHAKLSKMQEQL